jgi:hypothetical protein
LETHSSKLLVYFQSYLTLFLGYSVITVEFPHDAEKYLGWAEAATGIGLVAGPVIGSILFRFLKYRFTFVAFGGLLAIGGLFLALILPSYLNKPS